VPRSALNSLRKRTHLALKLNPTILLLFTPDDQQRRRQD
jgi:hypothetical protein